MTATRSKARWIGSSRRAGSNPSTLTSTWATGATTTRGSARSMSAAADGDRAFHRASQGAQADGEVPAQGDGGRQGQRRPQRGGDELLQAPHAPRSFVVVFAGAICGALCLSFAP